ncbi:hypothetical protein D9M68_671840 [compost metagenome]
MWCALGHGEVVLEHGHAFTRVDVLDGALLQGGAGGGAVPVLHHDHFARGHAVDGVVGAVHLQEGLLLLQQFEDALGVLRVLGALVHAQVVAGGVDQAAGGVQRGELALQLGARFEELLPGVVQLAAWHSRAVIGKAGGAPEIGRRVLAAGVEVRVAEGRLHMGEVRQAGGVDLLQVALLDQRAHDRVRRHDHVVGGTTGLQLGQQGLVAVVAVHGDLDAGLLLELGQQLHRVVVGPVVEEQLLGLLRLGEGRGETTQGETGYPMTQCFQLHCFFSGLKNRLGSGGTKVRRRVSLAGRARRRAPPGRWKSPASGWRWR